MGKEITNTPRLLLKFTREFIILIFFSVLFFILMNLVGHQGDSHIWAGILVIFSISKVYFLISKTLKKLKELIKNNHSFNHLLLLLSIIISIIIISFSIDYLCISEIYSNAFAGLNYNQPMVYHFFDLLYFSIVTFTTVGYGDIVPIAKTAKVLTILEMIAAFVTIVFIISNYIKKNN